MCPERDRTGADTVKVLHVVHWPNSGITSFLKNFLRQGGDHRHEYGVLFFLTDRAELDVFRKLCGYAESLDFQDNKFRALVRYRRVIRQFSPDIIHTHSFQPGFWARVLSVGEKAKIVSTVHSPYPYLEGSSLKDRLKSFLEIAGINMRNIRTVCVSDAVRRHLRENTRVKENLLQIIRNGIVVRDETYENFTLEKTKEEISPNGSARIIIAVGRLSEEKGLDILLTAFLQVAASSKDPMLAIVGAGPLEGALKARAVELGIRQRVRFLGFKEDVFPYLAVSHIYASPSRYEGLPMSLLEAMSMRVPVVATKVGGVAEVVEDGVTGVLVEPEAPRVLAEAILALLDNDILTERLRANGLARVRECFDISATVRDYERLYDECLLGPDKLSGNG